MNAEGLECLLGRKQSMQRPGGGCSNQALWSTATAECVESGGLGDVGR